MKLRYKIIIGTLSALILVGGIGGYMVYQKAGDYVLEKAMSTIMEKQLDEYLETLDIEAILAEQTEEVPQVDKAPTDKTGNSQETPSDQQTASQEDSATSKTESVGEPKLPGDATSVEAIKEAAKADIQSQAQAIVSQIPSKDKNTMIGLIVGNINASDMKMLVGLVADGNISGADIAKAKEVALRSFSVEQLEQVKHYYYKYAELVLK